MNTHAETMKKSFIRNAIKPPYFWVMLVKFYKLYAHRHKLHIFFLFIGAVFAGVLEILGIIALYYMIKILIKVDSLGATHFVSQIFDFLGLVDINSKIVFLGTFIACVFIGKNIYIMLYYYTQHLTLRKWKNDLSSVFMKGYLNAPYDFLIDYNSSTILRNISSTVSMALNGFILAAFNFMANVITGFIILSIIYIKYLFISIIVGAILTVSTLLQNYFLKKGVQKIGEERDILMADQNKNVYQGIHAIKETKVMGKESFFMQAFNQLNYKVINNDSQNMLIGRLPTHITEIVIIISIIVICVTVLTDPNHTSESSMASLGVLAAIAFRIAPIMNRTLNTLQNMNKNIFSIETMFSELEKLEKLASKTPEKIEPIDFNESIEFKDVIYKYPKAKSAALTKLDFKIQKGHFIGIVGASGAGKTTIMDIMLGLLQPSEGELKIDGVPITKSNVKSWQQRLSFVPQSIYLSDDSIKANIAFGVEEKDIDNEKLLKVLEKAHLGEFIKENSQGVDFKIGENGKKLSGGQKQRLAIARALYAQKDVLLLDEATSALDLKTEFEISKVLKEQAGDQTVIAIAHRLSTVYDADQIIFMEKGVISDCGSFKELVEKNKKFADLAELAKIN